MRCLILTVRAPLAVAACFGLAIALPEPAFAKDAAEGPAEVLIKEGIELRRAGRDADAVEKLQQAYDLAPTPRASAQLGLCLQAIGKWSEADGRLQEALSAPKDPWVRKNRDIIKDSLEVVKAHVGRVEVVGEPAGAEVLVNGKPSGTLPLKAAVTVNEGIVDVELMSPGFRRATRSLTIVGGGYQRLVLRLEREGPPTTSSSAGPMPSPNGALSVTDGALVQPAGAPIYHQPWFWGVAAAVAAGAIVGFLLLSGDEKAPVYDVRGELK